MRIVFALMLAAMGLVGCGGSEPTAAAKEEIQIEEEARERGFVGRQAETFGGARGICGLGPRSEFAVEQGLPADSTVAAIAHRYAAEWPRGKRRAALEGCKAGLARVPARFPQSPPQARGVWGQRFVATSVSGADEAHVTEPIRIRLSFSEEGEHGVGWEANCNGFGADVHFTETRMVLGQIGGTLVGCKPEFEEEDEWLARFLGSGPEWRPDGDRLQLTADSVTLELRASAE